MYKSVEAVYKIKKQERYWDKKKYKNTIIEKNPDSIMSRL